MWLNLLSLGVKTASHIYQNKQKTKQLMSDAQRVHAERMAKGELEYKAKVIESNDNGWKDEYFKNLPYWYQAIFIGVVSAIYGLKGADIMRKK